MKLLTFENWSSGELSKIGHHKVIQKLMLSKNVNNKKCASRFYSMKQKVRKIWMIFDIED